MQNYSVQPEALKKFTTAIFEAAGLKNNEAASIAELLVHADLRNVHSHGVLRTIPYLEKIQGGGASKTSTYPVIKETTNTAVIDAQGGLGALVGESVFAMVCSVLFQGEQLNLQKLAGCILMFAALILAGKNNNDKIGNLQDKHMNGEIDN